MGMESSEHSVFYRVLDSLPQGVIVADKNLNIIYLNEPAEDILNTSREKSAGKHASNFFCREIIKICEKALTEERVVQENDIFLSVSSRSHISVDCIVSPLYRVGESAMELTIQIRNTEKMSMMSIISKNSVIEEKYEMLVKGLAHEVKNPLSGIKGAAQLLNGELSEDEKNQCSRIIVKETERLRDLLDRLLKSSSISIQNLCSIDINEILLDVMFLESNLRRDIKFIHNLDVTIPPVPGDRNSLKQVFVNVIQNAVASIEGKGSITISTRWVTDYKIRNKNIVVISVRDTGTGIKEEDRKKIFTPFFSARKNGTGLGLFISNQIIAKHGGIIKVQSTEKKGSEFCIEIPANL